MSSLQHSLCEWPNIAIMSIRILFVFSILISFPCVPGFASGRQLNLQRDSIEDLEEIIVTGQSARQRLDNPQLGAEQLELSKLALTPSFGGENDIIKSISLLPGVRSESDGGGGFEVRGGTASQNLVILDGIPLYNPSHVMGIFSTFNDQALARATLYKGPFPTSYGSATSSVLDVGLAAGDMERFHGNATIGILAAKISAEGPIVKDKLSFGVALRRSYVDAFLKMVPQYRSTVMNFYDASAKLRFKPSTSHLIDASFFMSRDNMAIHNVMGMYWGNLGASVNWISYPSNSCTFSTNLAFDHFNPKMGMSVMQMDEQLKENIRTYSFNETVYLTLNDNHNFSMGLRSSLQMVKSGDWIANGAHEKEKRSLWENAIWFLYDGKLSPEWKINGGVRFNLSTVLTSPVFHSFQAVGQIAPLINTKTYFDPEPRISIKFNSSPFLNIKVGIGLSSQNLHAIRSSSTSFPFDRYAITSFEVKPERVLQTGIGYSGMTPKGDFDWSVEGYYKNLNNVYDYRDGRNSFSDINLQSLILGGQGRGYGLELMFRKNSGPLTGWIAYTLSHTQTRINGINDDKWYNATNDRRHDFVITAIYQFNKRWTISGTWIYSSGQPLTAPDVKYEISGITCYYYSRRNSYLTPPTHRLDLAATYSHAGKKFTYQWSFGVYNAYCRYNPYVVYFKDDPSKPSGTCAVLQAMYGLIPSISYTLCF